MVPFCHCPLPLSVGTPLIGDRPQGEPFGQQRVHACMALNDRAMSRSARIAGQPPYPPAEIVTPRGRQQGAARGELETISDLPIETDALGAWDGRWRKVPSSAVSGDSVLHLLSERVYCRVNLNNSRIGRDLVYKLSGPSNGCTSKS